MKQSGPIDKLVIFNLGLYTHECSEEEFNSLIREFLSDQYDFYMQYWKSNFINFMEQDIHWGTVDFMNKCFGLWMTKNFTREEIIAIVKL